MAPGAITENSMPPNAALGGHKQNGPKVINKLQAFYLFSCFISSLGRHVEMGVLCKLSTGV